ncbi:tetratricopeptide repeat protein [Nisaea acidiphila]|uniref:Tetratricopeptide repeat protein n=1 Tax=Nisaea acidiphila TaxID=1862145 RepID=A0A9J7AVE6_9PROT|nr:tetratricopeptide repeat protein [Nisaea acidiphila]UUX51311.1 tetratricopeptide repeat protein [Nisaea acidiphila]
MRRGRLIPLLALLGLLVFGGQSVAQEIDHEQEYSACMQLARERPEDAYRSGLVWHKLGGGFPARHCIAVALLELRQYDEAAARLERLATDLGTARTGLLANIMMQAGQAWYLAGRAEKALKIQNNLLDFAPGDPELWLDRAVSLMDLERFEEALGDLDEAIRLNPDLTAARTYRAVALRELDRLEDAWKEVETVLALLPYDPDALLERGILRQYQGDLEGARADWLAVIQYAPETSAATAARARIEEMDVVVQ